MADSTSAKEKHFVAVEPANMNETAEAAVPPIRNSRTRILGSHFPEFL